MTARSPGEPKPAGGRRGGGLWLVFDGDDHFPLQGGENQGARLMLYPTMSKGTAGYVSRTRGIRTLD